MQLVKARCAAALPRGTVHLSEIAVTANAHRLVGRKSLLPKGAECWCDSRRSFCAAIPPLFVFTGTGLMVLGVLMIAGLGRWLRALRGWAARTSAL